jgi:hypothetical protein
LNERRPAPIIVLADFGSADFAWLDGLRRAHFPADRNVVPAHLALFHHLPPSLLDELESRLRAETRAVPCPVATIGEPILFGRGVALRVRGAALEAIRDRQAEAFERMLTPQDAAPWRPHVTIQNKADPTVARRLHADLTASHGRPRPLRITGLITVFYRDGGWEPINRHRFTG